MTKFYDRDLRQIISSLELFICISFRIQGYYGSLPIDIGWQVFEYSLKCGLVLSHKPLLKLWDMFITQKQLPYLAQVTNYLMERPTVDRKLLGERLAQTLTIVTECPKISKRPEIISALLPGLLSIDPR